MTKKGIDRKGKDIDHIKVPLSQGGSNRLTAI
jgi:hypothetical protein